MRISTFFYTLGQGFKNLVRNGWYTLASIATITASLFLFGLFYSVLANFENALQEASKGLSVSVFFQEGTGEEQMLALKAELERRPEVNEVVYKSAEQAWEEFRDIYLGEYAAGFGSDNPLEDSASLDVFLKDVSKQPTLVAYVESITIVRQVNRSESVATTFTALGRMLSIISMAIIGLLIAVSVFLISNTVAIGISVRSEEIGIMKYIGATDFFVRAPFVIEGIIIGLVGSLLPALITYFLYRYAVSYLSTNFSMLNIMSFLPVEAFFGRLLLIMVGVGVGIGFLGSIVTVRKHLRV
ncbi:MAG: permease-like cell division protein FtsX [Lachnospiraceae bacterium]|nr:permease-like cell division protein FtsX [Lachnospiraceae bacterium]